ncbi:phosphoribosyltransferase family protein [Sphaerisporangium sp. NPDC049002]|uniref:ComF family protein n=1 Tax=Sphaerisporangium sp. NPDC049002 TaxID=3155392 RepID=UPI003410A8EC
MTAFLDLVLPARCAGCARAGAVVCPACAAELHGDPCPRAPSPAPHGLPACWAAARYEGAARRAILAYKERGRTSLARALAAPLAATLVAALREAGALDAPSALVPIPSSRGAVRRRGHDPVGRLAELAVRALRAQGRPVTLAPVLAQCRRVRDQAGLSASQRAANLAGAFGVRQTGNVREHPLWGRPGPFAVLVDDIVTTGTTLAQAAEALRREGVVVPLAVTLAATPRRARHARLSPIRKDYEG